jgi:glycosyltransferase involved in cell wall biosynthesis
LLGPNRRTQDAIEATEVLLKKGKKVKLIVVGGEKHFPGYKEVLRSYAENIRISDHVILAGAIDEIELPDYYAACDIFLYPHINQSWGLAPFEAMAAKRPTIVSLDTGAAEILKDRINSMIVAPMNPELIAEKVIELMENSDLNKNIVANAFAFVRDEISWEKYSREMMKVFEDEVKKDRN